MKKLITIICIGVLSTTCFAGGIPKRTITTQGNVPLLINQDGVLTSDNVHHYKLEEGKSWHASIAFLDTTDGENHSLFIIPSTDTLHLNVSIASDAKGYYEIYKNPVVISSGTKTKVINRDISISTDTVNGKVYYDPSIKSSGTIVSEGVTVGGEKTKSVGGLTSLPTDWIVPKGESFIIFFKNTSGGIVDISMQINWWKEE